MSQCCGYQSLNPCCSPTGQAPVAPTAPAPFVYEIQADGLRKRYEAPSAAELIALVEACIKRDQASAIGS